MPIDASTLENLLKGTFNNAKITITDLKGDNDHWSVEIVSEDFIGKSRIQSHKMVYGSLQGKMGNEIHAMQLKTSTPNS